MQINVLKCSNRVVRCVQCACNSSSCIKYGRTNTGKQRYRCKSCNKTFIHDYKNVAYTIPDNSITSLLKEGCGIRSISRLLKISNTTVLRRILRIARNISRPVILLNKAYEVDEMCTFYKRKSNLLWIVYAVQKDSRLVADFAVGSRTKATLQKVINTLFLSGADKIYTDKLNIYTSIIPPAIHCSKQYSINHIERKNLTLRTHLKRLSRRTICFSKSLQMLTACLRIYFWNVNHRNLAGRKTWKK